MSDGYTLMTPISVMMNQGIPFLRVETEHHCTRVGAIVVHA